MDILEREDIERIRDSWVPRIKKVGISVCGFERKADIAINTISQIINKKATPNIYNFHKIEKTLRALEKQAGE